MVDLERFGISAALLTPFKVDGSVDLRLFASHAKSVLRRGASSITIFGTTGEGASVSPVERLDGLRHLLDSGISPDQILPTIYASALGEAIQQIVDASETGVTKFLLVPPHYFKGCSDDGLYAWHEDLLRSAPRHSKFVLYHIPQVTGVPLSPSLIARLAEEFSDRLIGIKDSSGDWDNTLNFLDLISVPVLVGDERMLHHAVARGGAGAITGMANLYPDRMHRLFQSATEDVELSAEVGRIVVHPVIPALKAMLARNSENESWERVRAPLEPLDAQARSALGL